MTANSFITAKRDNKITFTSRLPQETVRWFVNLGYVEVDTMIRAVVKNGVIQPLEPMPADWKEGREVVVDDLTEQPASESDGFDNWLEDMKTLTAGLNNPQEWQEIEATLAEADRLNKDQVRREMGLP